MISLLIITHIISRSTRESVTMSVPIFAPPKSARYANENQKIVVPISLMSQSGLYSIIVYTMDTNHKEKLIILVISI